MQQKPICCNIVPSACCRARAFECDGICLISALLTLTGSFCVKNALAVLYEDDDFQRSFWLVNAAKKGDPKPLLAYLPDQIASLKGGCDNLRRSMFLTGSLLDGQIDVERRTILGSVYGFDQCYVAAEEAVRFFRKQCQAAREAIDAWTLVGIRLKVMKDIRVLIGRMVWKVRWDADYDWNKSAREDQSFGRKLRAERRLGKKLKSK